MCLTGDASTVSGYPIERHGSTTRRARGTVEWMHWVSRCVVISAASSGVALSACLLPSFDDVRADAQAGDASNGDVIDGGDGGLIGCNDPTALVIWPMTEGSGTTIHDCTGNYPGTMTGAVAWTTGRNGLPALDMQGGFVSIVSSPALSITGPFTIAAWFNASSTQSDMFGDIFARYAAPNNAVFDLTVTKDPKIALTLFGATTFQIAPIIKYAVYTHVAATYDPTTGSASIFLNGILAQQGTGPTVLPTVPVPMSIGANDTAASIYIGQIAGLRVYTRVLSTAEIVTLVQ